MKKRSLLCVLLSIVLMLGFNLNAFASPESDESVEVADDNFIEICDLLFSGYGEVYDSNGSDITSSFISEYFGTYQSRDYSMILSKCYAENISQIRTHKATELSSSARASVLQLAYEDSITHFITNNAAPYEGKSWYVTVTASGTYGYAEPDNRILSCNNPSMSVSFGSLGALFSGNIERIRSSTPLINNNAMCITFTVYLEHTVSCPIPGVDHITGTLGPFNTESNFTIYHN